MGPGRYVEIVAGIAVLILVFYDLYQEIVLPRPSVYRLPLVSQFLVRWLWIGWRSVGSRRPHLERRESFLASFGPAVLLLQLAFWSLCLILGYGLIIDGLCDQITPRPPGLLTSIYLSAETLLPVNYGDLVPTGWASRTAVLAESGSGVLLVALVITLVFSLYQSFQAREVLVVTLDSLAGAPPSGLQILATAAAHPMPLQLL